MLQRSFGRKNTLVKAVEALELINHCSKNEIPLRVLAATYTFPVIDKDRYSFFKTNRIPQATFFDIDEVADTSTPVPHTLPGLSQFHKQMAELDIAKDDVILVYDDFSVLGSSRAWWTFRTFGFKSWQPNSIKGTFL